MSTIKKKRLLFALLTLVVLVGSWAVYRLFIWQEPYNKNPDLTAKKDVEAILRDGSAFCISMEDLTYYADVILVGAVLRDDVRVGQEARLKELPVTSHLYAEIQIEKILAGSAPESPSFFLLQVRRGSEEPLIKKGERCLFILANATAGTYRCVNGVSSVFYLNEDNRLTSMSACMACAKYDGLSLRTFVRDLQRSYYYPVIGKPQQDREQRRERFRNDLAAKRKIIREWYELTGEDYFYLLQ